MNTVKLELSLEETQNLIGFLDVAVKSLGLQAAQPAFALFVKIKDAAEQSNGGFVAPNAINP